MSYEIFLQSIKSKWLQGPNAQAWQGAWGLLLDDQIDRIKQSVKARFPDYAPSDALPAIGDERQLDRGPFESDTSYIGRLKKAWDVWPFAGTPTGLMVALYYGGFTNVVLVQQNGLYYTFEGPPDPSDYTLGLSIGDLGTNPVMTGSPPWWTFDARLDFCSRYAILLPGPAAGTQYQIAGVATFTGVEDGTVANPWPTVYWTGEFPDTSYSVMTGGITVTDGQGDIAAWVPPELKAQSSCQVAASAPFSGTVDVLAYFAGTNPFGTIDLNRIRSIIRKWGRAAATCKSISVQVYGDFIGWPVRAISDRSTIGPSWIATYVP